ncbi:MAG: hypothetical protein KDJ69_06485 [Nitratireductor sp.]|nr:hypothetical protein [Nitratireductor sp.]
MLKSLFRILALFALALALVTAVLDITRSIADSAVVMTPLGVDWFNLSPSTLNLAQATIQRYVHPYIWDPVIQTILLAPSWVVFAILWLLFSLAGRQRKLRLQDRYGD